MGPRFSFPLVSVLAILNDLLFRSKLEGAAAALGVPLTVAASPEAVAEALRTGEVWKTALVDVNHPAALELIRLVRQQDSALLMVGYCSHVQTELQAQAREAGCSVVMPRSAFVQCLPDLLRGEASTSDGGHR